MQSSHQLPGHCPLSQPLPNTQWHQAQILQFLKELGYWKWQNAVCGHARNLNLSRVQNGGLAHQTQLHLEYSLMYNLRHTATCNQIDEQQNSVMAQNNAFANTSDSLKHFLLKSFLKPPCKDFENNENNWRYYPRGTISPQLIYQIYTDISRNYSKLQHNERRGEMQNGDTCFVVDTVIGLKFSSKCYTLEQMGFSYPLQIVVSPSWSKYGGCWMQSKEKWFHVPVEVTVPLPWLCSISSIHITSLVSHHQHCWPLHPSANSWACVNPLSWSQPMLWVFWNAIQRNFERVGAPEIYVTWICVGKREVEILEIKISGLG